MTGLGYVGAGLVLAAMGVWGVAALAHPLRKLLALNILGSGVFLVLVATADHGSGQGVDPVPHALVLTGLVVAVSATALGVLLMLRSREQPAASGHARSNDEGVD